MDWLGHTVTVIIINGDYLYSIEFLPFNRMQSPLDGDLSRKRSLYTIQVQVNECSLPIRKACLDRA